MRTSTGIPYGAHMSTSNLIGAPEAARRAGMSRRGFLYAIERGDIKATRISGGRNAYVIEESELDRFVNNRLKPSA